METLPFDPVIAVDFEYSAPDGENPNVACMVAKNLQTGKTWRYFHDELLTMPAPPFPTDQDAMIVAYYASAEMNCFLALGWALPANVLDLFVEFRCLSNGLPLKSGGAGLLGAMSWHGLEGLDVMEKQEMRELAMRGGPYTDQERQYLLDYCESDVIALQRLLPLMLPTLDLPRALQRGRYMKAAARIETNGIPVDIASLTKLRDHWDDIQDELIATIDRDFGIYDGRTFKTHRFAGPESCRF